MLKILTGKIEGEYLYIVVEGANCEEVSNAAARKAAYEARHKYGFSNAGIDMNGGPYVVDMSKDDPQNSGFKGKEVTTGDMKELSNRPDDIGYRQVYRLTRSLA